MNCRICNNDTNNVSYTGREMYFGFRDEFEYFQCGSCGCLQIAKFPENLSKYYPKEYGAYKLHEKIHENKVIRYLKRKKLEVSLGMNNNLIGTLSNFFIDKGFVRYLEPTHINIDSSILDVGTGIGSRLIGLKKKGFKNVTGIEPFIEKDIYYDVGVSVFKKHLHEFEGQFDMVMLNHSFEHMPDPLQAMKDIYRLLKTNCIALIRIPVADSFAWEKYRTNWMAMDPPRHFFLHTTKSMEILAHKVGFEISEVIYDSKDFQYAASEQLKRDIPLQDPNSYYVNRKLSMFTKSELKEFAKLAKQLNETKRGDTACFYLYKK
jgi:2-polyprenyl-3-methyl-5-hydroxy-6-metoxy-1,4-benzoquinol methylase